MTESGRKTAGLGALQSPVVASFTLKLARRLARHPALAAAFGVILILFLLALLAPVLSDILGSSPESIDLDQAFRPPAVSEPKWWLGADEFGRSQLIRLIFGGRVSLFFAALVAAINLSIGITLGIAAGYYRGLVDELVNWVITTMVSIPSIFLLLAVATLFRPSPLVLAIFFGLISWTGVARLVRGQTFSLREREYVMAAQALGAGAARIMLRHILPNVTPIVIVITGMDVAMVILGESALSYLGLGIQPPMPSWGNMLSNAGTYLFRAWWLVIGPGVCITLTVLCLYVIGDGLRDALDPRFRNQPPA